LGGIGSIAHRPPRFRLPDFSRLLRLPLASSQWLISTTITLACPFFNGVFAVAIPRSQFYMFFQNYQKQSIQIHVIW